MAATRYAIILTHDRPELLRDCVAAVAPQCEVVIVIDNASDPPVRAQDLPALGQVGGCVLGIPDQPPNIAYMWNRALDLATNSRANEPGPWWIAVLCDDTVIPDGWYAAVVDAMVATGAAAGCSNPFGHQHPPQLKMVPDGDIMGRMPGWAFILDGTKGLRADETMRWWWCDTDLDWQARQAGGMVMVGGHTVPNRLPNDYTVRVAELGEQAGRDGETFAAKWGQRPW